LALIENLAFFSKSIREHPVKHEQDGGNLYNLHKFGFAFKVMEATRVNFLPGILTKKN
jgi:hypothetical protein